MRKLFLILAVLFAFAAHASAQAPTPFSVYAGGAFSLPQSDAFKSAFKNGYHGFAGVGFKMSPMMQLIGKLEYHVFKFDFENNQSMDGYSGGTNKMLMFGADVKFSPKLPAAPVKPYLLGGLGVAHIKQSEFDGPQSLSLSVFNSYVSQAQTKLYYNLGAGIDLASSPTFGLFAQARYVAITTDGETSAFIPISLGLRFF